jgi:carbon monoxide dehydrogenase subunit G
MLARTLLIVAACSATLAPAESTPPVGAAPCIACRAPVADVRAGFTLEEWDALEAGAVLRRTPHADEDAAEKPSDDSGETRAESLIPRPPAQVWTVLTDFERWPDFMPHIRSTSVARRVGTELWVEQRYRILLVPLAHTTIYALDAQDGQLRWRLDEEAPHDIAASEGAWRLVSVSDGRATLVRYDARMSAGRAVPAFVERMLRERSLEQLLANLRDEVVRRHPEN